MKKTEYFLSVLRQYNQGKEALADVVEKRNAFIEQNIKLIGEIDSENAELISNNSQTLYALLRLTYFPK